jgi:hypothetical protein
MGARVRAIATITAENTFTPWASLRGNGDISVSGVSDSTVTVQRSFDGGLTAKDIESFTANFERTVDASEQGAVYRVGVKTGDYGTDTILARISQ